MKVQDLHAMEAAFAEAEQAAREQEVPVGAVLVYQGKLIARAHNQPIAQSDPSAHAEIQVLRLGAQFLKNYRLNETVLYVTLEPCPMCVYAMIHARVGRCVFGARDPKTGALGGAIDLNSGPFNHRLETEGGVLAEKSSALLQAFFKARRR